MILWGSQIEIGNVRDQASHGRRKEANGVEGWILMICDSLLRIFYQNNLKKFKQLFPIFK